MNYGDEMNDDEEKSYRKELIEKRKRERREKEEAERAYLGLVLANDLV